MKEHTPGPWVASACHVQKGGRSIAFASSGSGVSCGPEEARANARLIASAPDMLAALESIVVEADNGLDCHLLAEIAAAAIAKAKGL